MPRIEFTSALNRFFPELKPLEIDGDTVAEVVTKLDLRFPGLAAYLVDEHGSLRKHVNIFIGERLIRDRTFLSDPVSPKDEVYFMQSLSGG